MLQILRMGMDILWTVVSIEIPLNGSTGVKMWQIFLFAIILALILKEIKKIGEGEKNGK